MQMNSIFKEFKNLSVEKKTLSTALGFEPRSFDCRSTALTTELYTGVRHLPLYSQHGGIYIKI